MNLPERISLPEGLFFRLYELQGAPRGVVYNTPSQAVALLEGDSARVFALLHEHGGATAPALDYIVANGEFAGGDVVDEARQTLCGFLDSLAEASLTVDGDGADEALRLQANEGLQATVDSPEMEIASLMAGGHVLYSLMVELTYRCNERCQHCYCPENRQTHELSFDELRRLFDEFRALGGFRLELSGGELFLRRDIVDILGLVRERGFLLDVISNLNLLNEETLEALLACHPRQVGCSIYSADAATHDGVTRLPGSFAKSLANIRRLRERGAPVLLKTPLMAHTLDGWRGVRDLALELGCGWHCDPYIIPRYDGDMQTLALRARDREKLTELYRSAFYQIRVAGESLEGSSAGDCDEPICAAGQYGLAVSPEGVVRPCLGLMEELGRYPQDSLAGIWSSGWSERWAAESPAMRRQCDDCEAAESCSRCPGAWKMETGSTARPSPYNCYLSKIWREARG